MRGGRLSALVAVILGVLTFVSPASAATSERSVYYGYDVAGRQLTEMFDSTTGGTHQEGITNTYDGAVSLTATCLWRAELSHCGDASGESVLPLGQGSRATGLVGPSVDEVAFGVEVVVKRGVDACELL